MLVDDISIKLFAFFQEFYQWEAHHQNHNIFASNFVPLWIGAYSSGMSSSLCDWIKTIMLQRNIHIIWGLKCRSIKSIHHIYLPLFYLKIKAHLMFYVASDCNLSITTSEFGIYAYLYFLSGTPRSDWANWRVGKCTTELFYCVPS